VCHRVIAVVGVARSYVMDNKLSCQTIRDLFHGQRPTSRARKCQIRFLLGHLPDFVLQSSLFEGCFRGRCVMKAEALRQSDREACHNDQRAFCRSCAYPARSAVPSSDQATPAFILLDMTFPSTSRVWISSSWEQDR